MPANNHPAAQTLAILRVHERFHVKQVSQLPADHESQVTMLQVFTAATEAPKNYETVSASARDGKNADGSKRTVAADQRYRGIHIPELSVPDVPSKFQLFVLDALRSVAKKQLDSLWAADANIREVPAVIWGVDALLKFASLEAASKRLTKENCAAWFDASKLAAAVAKKGPAQLAAWKDTIVGCAATTLQMKHDEDQCNRIIAALGKMGVTAEDVIGSQIIAKCEARIREITRVVEEIALEDVDFDAS